MRERAAVREAGIVTGAADEGAVDERGSAVRRHVGVGGLDIGVGPADGVHLGEAVGPRAGDPEAGPCPGLPRRDPPQLG